MATCSWPIGRKLITKTPGPCTLNREHARTEYKPLTCTISNIHNYNYNHNDSKY